VHFEGSLACGFLPACTDVGESDARPVKSAPKDDRNVRVTAAKFRKLSR